MFTTLTEKYTKIREIVELIVDETAVVSYDYGQDPGGPTWHRVFIYTEYQDGWHDTNNWLVHDRRDEGEQTPEPWIIESNFISEKRTATGQTLLDALGAALAKTIIPGRQQPLTTKQIQQLEQTKL